MWGQAIEHLADQWMGSFGEEEELFAFTVRSSRLFGAVLYRFGHSID
jgi:hypothetical protein